MKFIFTVLILLTIQISYAANSDCPPEDEQHKYLSTPIDFENPTAGHYKLHYKLQNPFDRNKKTLFLLHGGPGEGMSGFDKCPDGYCFHQLKNSYNIVAIDERGAGCSIPPQESNSEFTTIKATAEDIEYLKKHLVGEEGKISIFGVSFGTVVGIVMAATHPNSVERLILEGSLLDNSYQENLPKTIAHTLENLYREKPEVKILNDIIERKALKDELRISYEEFEGMRDTFALYGYNLIWNVFPQMLEELNNNKYDLYDKLEKAFGSVVNNMTQTPAYLYIMCREIVDFNAEENRFTEGVQKICKNFEDENPFWHKWNALDYTTNISTPTLLLTGQTDSVTAPYNAITLNQNISDSAFFNVTFAGHGALWENPKCDLALITDFLENGISNNLDTIFNSDTCQAQ